MVASSKTSMFTPKTRFDVLREIEKLEPSQDNARIAFLSTTYDFPWDTQKAYELALIRTFAVPNSSNLMVATGEFTERTQKRYDDTVIIISTIGFYGYDSPEGRAAIRRMNQIHGRYQIPNEEFLYVLSTFVFEPIRWNTKYGWRKLSDKEKLAGFYFWREVGRYMNIKDIPETIEDFETFNLEYEQQHFAYHDDNKRLAEATRNLFLSWFLPKSLWGFGSQFIYTLMDKPMREAFGFPEPRLWATWTVEAGFKTRALIARYLPPRKTPYRLPPTRTYPKGYDIENIGADKSVYINKS
jgi:ER-bound oxygenase mpaB/B'/Rubber oxygenase, catalytic domain